MSKKASAFQVYSEDQVHQRHARSYRNPQPRQQTNSYKSPPPQRSGRTLGADWRDDVKVDSRSGRRSTSPELRRDRSYNDYDKYDSQRLDTSSYARDSRYGEDIRRNDGNERAQTRYRSDEQYDRRSWERDDLDRHNDYVTDRDRGGSNRLKDDYLIVDTQREAASKGVRGAAQYSDSDEECLHESLRRKKHNSQQFSDNDDERRWSTDDDYEDYRQARKRTLGGDNYRSPSPTPAKVWREDRQFRQADDSQNAQNYSDYGGDSDRGRVALPEPSIKKKKAKGLKKNSKAKEKKRKAGAVHSASLASSKIQSLMDVQIPTSVKKQIEESSVPALPRFGESRSEFRFDHPDEELPSSSGSRNLPRNQDEDRGHSKYDNGNRNRSRFDDDRYPERHREPPFSRRESESDKKGNHSHKDSYSVSRRSPEYDRRTYHHSDDDFDRDRDRQHRTSFGRNSTDVPATKRKRQNSVDRRDWQRTGNRSSQKDRSPDFRTYSDSDQDSEREGGRRSWRDERRDRQPKRKDEDKEKNHKGDKGDKKSKSKQVDSKEPKKSAAVKKEKRSEQDVSKMQVLPCDKGSAVLLTHPQQVCIRGRAKVRVLAGEMSVMGYVMTAKASKTYDFFSPTTSSLLTITTCSAEKEKKVLRKAVRGLGLDEKIAKDFASGAVVFVASTLDSPSADYICSHPPFTQIFRHSFDKPTATQAAATTTPEPAKVGASFLTSEQALSSCIKNSDDFDQALKKWSNAVKESKVAPTAVLCGGVNSGKSTMSRFMVNTALRVVPKVCYLDFDVGQTEFSPPGTVSLTVVNKPVFGPPFCHQKTAESMCFFGMVSPADGPTRYIRCLQHVFKAYQQMDPAPPLIVNTMGWNEGLGLKLFVDILQLVIPDFVIQLNVATNVLVNFPAITPEYPALESGWLYNTEPQVEEEVSESGSKKKKHELVVVKSLVSSRFDHTRVKLTPKNMRDLSLLSHLMRGFSPTVTLTSAVPYVVPWNRFAIHVCHCPVPRRLVVDALNASVVALCKADLSEATRTSEDQPFFFDETPVCECLGYGLVRAIDHKKQMLYVVTPMRPDRLAQVNTLLRGSVTIPDQLFLKQSHLEDVPYIDALEPAMALTPVRPRSRMPRRN